MVGTRTLGLLVSSFTLLLVATAAAQPRLEIIGGDTYDWGKVTPGRLTAVVKVRNAGDAELRISDVHASCGCTVASVDRTRLAPGDTASMNIALDATTRSGTVVKKVSIASNDSTDPFRPLYVKAQIFRSLVLSPLGVMTFTDAVVGAESAATPMTIRNAGTTPFTVEVPTLLEGSSMAVRVDMTGPRELKPGEEFVLRAFVTPKDSARATGVLRVRTTSNETPTFDINIAGTVLGTPAAATAQPAAARPSPARAAPHR